MKNCKIRMQNQINNPIESILQAASEFSGIILESHDDVEDGRDSQLLPGILIQLVIHTIY